MTHVNISWTLNPPIFSGGSSYYVYLRKKGLVFAEYVGFGDVFTRMRDIPLADPSISVDQMTYSDCTNDENDLHQKAYQFLRSALKTKVDINILYRARSTVEA